MKVKRIQWLPVLSIVFAAFIVGFFAGRNLDRTPVQIQTLRTAPVSANPVSEATAPPAAEAAETAPVSEGLININTAGPELLDTLPGIGPELARRIVDYRNTNGPFVSIASLINVNGIGEKKLEGIWDYVTVEGE